MSTPPFVAFDDLLAGFDWVGAAPFENSALVSRATGLVHWVSTSGALDDEDELPDDIDDGAAYVAVPSKQDLQLGKSLALDFAREAMPDAFDQVCAIFSRRGAYARFKDLLDRHGLLDAWHAHEARHVEAALREWAAGHGLVVTPPPRQDGR